MIKSQIRVENFMVSVEFLLSNSPLSRTLYQERYKLIKKIPMKLQIKLKEEGFADILVPFFALRATIRTEYWRKRVAWLSEVPGRVLPVSGRIFSEGLADWGTWGPAVCPGYGWSSEVSSERLGCKSRGLAKSLLSSFVNFQLFSARAAHGALEIAS